MSGEIIPFNHNADNQPPAHLTSVFGEEGNIAPRQTINQLSYRGKVWRRVVAGEEVQLTRTSPEGDVEPMPIVQVILLDHNKQRSRSFFEGAYEEGKTAAPRCYSGDGVKPDASVHEPISATCATCPNAVKGSKITESGAQSTLCSPFKRVAVIPSAQIGQHPAMLLKLAQTSIWDGKNPEEANGWYAWDNYLDMLRARGAKHTGMVETRIKFDMRVAYPKLLFLAARWLSPEEAQAVRGVIETQATDIDAIIHGAGNADGVMGQPENGGVAAGGTNGAQAPAPAAQGPAPAPTQAPAPAPTQAAKPKAPPKPPAAPAPAPTQPPKIVKKIDLAKTDGFNLEQMLENGWTEEQLVSEGMLTITEEPAAPKAPPKPPTKPKAPPKAPAAPAMAPAATDTGFGAAPTPPAPAPAATPPAGVVADTPAGLSSLLQEWDGE